MRKCSVWVDPNDEDIWTVWCARLYTTLSSDI